MKNFSHISKISLRGLALASLLMGSVAGAQITTTAASSTPGMPTTGAGGAAAMNITLLVSSLILVAGGVYAMRKTSPAHK